MSFQLELPISRDMRGVLASPAWAEPGVHPMGQSLVGAGAMMPTQGAPQSLLPPWLGCPRDAASVGTDVSLESWLVPVLPIWHSTTPHRHGPVSSWLQLGVDGLFSGQGLGTAPRKGRGTCGSGQEPAGLRRQTTISNLDWRGGQRAGGEESEINVSSFLK